MDTAPLAPGSPAALHDELKTDMAAGGGGMSAHLEGTVGLPGEKSVEGPDMEDLVWGTSLGS